MMKKQNLFLFILLFLGNMILNAQCSVNAGGNTTICGTSYTLQGSSSGTTGSPVWTLITKPPGAPDPVISNVNSLTPIVTGMTFPGNYVFQLAQNCSTSGSGTSQVTITAPGDVSTFTAGPDITTIPATTGVANLTATVPNGYTASWTYYNLNSFEFNGSVVTTNATMSNTNTATPTLTLAKKSDHDIDPSYRAVLRITSNLNPSCYYEDDAIVRFIPNPNVIFPNTINFCGSQASLPTSRYYYDTSNSSPKFSDNTANASANSLNGTTITMNIISQPAGGNIAYGRMQNGRLYFASGFNQTIGSYVFTLTITNAIGSYTTQQLTFNYNGSQPEPLSFVDAAYPEQMELYTAGNSAGAVYCNRAGTTTPITINFKLNPVDSPTLTSSITTSTIIPGGAAPTISAVSGAGTMNRTYTLTPPSGGWQVGTYKFSVEVGNGTCKRSHVYYIHISDGLRPNVNVNNTTVCYSGSGAVSATIPLPQVYKGAVNPSYFQEYGGRYEFTVVSKPIGSATPAFDPVSLRSFTNTSTVISNLNMQGEYVFKITATPSPGGDAGFIQKEYACSGTSYEDTFSVFVSAQVGANAGSNQNVVGTTATLNGNNPGVASTGVWTLVSKPAGVSNPVIVTPSAYNTNVTGLTQGTYVFRWTITTGTCTSSSDVSISVQTISYCTTGCNDNTFLNATDPNTIEYDNLIATDIAIMAKEKDGTFKIWGFKTSPKTDPGNPNLALDLLVPTAIIPTNGFTYTGTPLKVAITSNHAVTNSGLLTTDGLYTWGSGGYLISNTFKDTNTGTPAFSKITVNGKADGLPPGVSPTDVKMMFGNETGLSIVTCKGEAWILTNTIDQYYYGDGMPATIPNTRIWHRVKTSATETLDNIVAIRGAKGAKFALTSEGKLYTWGIQTYIGDGTDNATNGTNRLFATEVVVPTGITPKMIGLAGSTYFLLATNGKLFAMGRNDYQMLGDNTTTASNLWKEITATSGSNILGGNIAWISPGEHSAYSDSFPSINVLTNDKKQWGWGSNYEYKLGQAVTNSASGYGPTYMPGNTTNADGMGLNDEIIAVETGGFFAINYKNGNPYFGFVGRSNYGTIGNGSTGIPSFQKYTYNTGLVDICAAASASVPFTCDTKFYLTQYGSAATDKTILYTLDNTTNPFTKTIIGESPAGMKVNGIGYNTLDNFLYGMRTDAANATHMVKIDATGTFTDLGAVTSLPAGGFNAGGFDNAGNYYIINFDSSNLYKINVTTNTAAQITLSRSLKVNDIAFDSTTNLFYGYEQSTGQLVSISTSGVVTNVGSPSALGNVFFGAMYSDSNGDIFGNEDDGSGFYQFNKTTGHATKISESISAFGNDGANCSNAVITFPADLSITKTDGKTTYIPGSATTYTIVVSNNSGAYGVLGATVSDPVPAGIPAANVSYSVPVLTGGATTSITGPQTGALNDVVGLPIGGTITYTVTVNVPLTFTGNLTNTVTVTPPVNSTDPNTANNTATDTNTNGVCYKPGVTAGTALDTKVGITSLNRAGATDADNWPMARKGGWLALESKTKGFVPNRVAFTDADANPTTPDTPVGIAAANFREGMMVYDTTNKCLKVYTMKDGDTSMAWHCVTTQTCPD